MRIMGREGEQVGLAALVVAAIVIATALTVWYAIVFPRQPFTGPPAAATASELRLAYRLRQHIAIIAAAPRNMEHFEALEATAAFIERELVEMGYRPIRQVYAVEDRKVRNIEVVIEPSPAAPAPASYVVGAHYDSPDDSPGANDNATGVAALLEIARALRDLRTSANRLRLVFFVNEEHPYGKTDAMGSLQHARRLKNNGETVAGMIALETIGFFSDAPGSQAFPAPFGLVYPDRGNFVAFVALPGGRRLLHRCVAAFRRNIAFPAIGGIAPGFIDGVDLSDHWSYHQLGFPALMVTDTAPFRNPYYHAPGDLPDTVDYASLARVTVGLERMLRAIVD